MTAPTERLRQRVLNAGGWTVIGAVVGHFVRFGVNLILARLLFPEAFGLMAILTAVLVGVSLVSDVGLSASIVRSRRGEEELFLNTVWTMQIVRGILIALLIGLLSGSIAAAYEQPPLAEMLPVVALIAVINGLNSTKSDLALRNVQVKRNIAIGLVAQVIGAAVMVAMAWRWPSPWALLSGNLSSAAIVMLGTHMFLPGPRNRLAWDAAAAHEVLRFGGWVMAGSAIAFLAGDGAQLVRAALVDVRLLGLMGLATALSGAAWMVMQQVAGRVLFPAYAEVWREDPPRLARVVERSRRVQLVACGLFSAVMVVLGPALVRLLYDARYEDAGLILQMQSAGLMPLLLSTSYFGVLHSLGRPGLSTAILSCQVVIGILCMIVGGAYMGAIGVVVGSALTGWLLYPINAWLFNRLGLWQPRTDLPMLVAACLAAVWIALNADWTAALKW